MGSAGGVVVIGPAFAEHLGLHLMDSNDQTLCVYQYSPGEKMLPAVRGPNSGTIRKLEDFNTLRPPMDVKDWWSENCNHRERNRFAEVTGNK